MRTGGVGPRGVRVRGVPDPDAIAATCGRYIELLAIGAVDEIVALYADDASVEDPVGTEPKVGDDAIDAFYRDTLGSDGVPAAATGPVRVCGHEAAFPFEVRYGEEFVLPIIDVMSFGDDGRITSMRAFWSIG